MAERIVRAEEILPRQTDKIDQNREAIEELIVQVGQSREAIDRNRESIKELTVEVRRNSEMIKPQGEMLNQRIEDMIRHSEKRFSHHQHAGYRLQVRGDNALNRCSGGAVKGLPG